MTPGDGSPVFSRILVKLSGEALSGKLQFGIDAGVLQAAAAELAAVANRGVEVGVVIGGGNFFRGVQSASENMDRVSADYIGMLATVMNSIALQQALESQSTKARVLSAIPMSPLVEPYVRARALKHLLSGKIVIFAAGTGNPLFTTDSAASLRAIEIDAQLMLKATNVDGVYDFDPKQNSNAKRFEFLSYNDVLVKNLKVMDATAVALCRDHGMPIRVFDVNSKGILQRLAYGGNEGTLIGSEETK